MTSSLHAEAVRSTPSVMFQKASRVSGAIARFERSSHGDRSEYSYLSNPELSIPIESELGWVDMGTGFLSFKVIYTGTIPSSAQIFFMRWEIQGPQGLLYELDNADVFTAQMQKLTLNSTQENTSFALTELTGPESWRASAGHDNVRGGDVGAYVTLAVPLDLCRGLRYLPFHCLGTCKLIAKLQLPSTCLIKSSEQNAPDNSFTISQVVLKHDIVQFDAATEDALMSAFRSDRLRFHFSQWYSWKETSALQQVILKIPNTHASLRGVLIVPRKVSTTVDPTKDSYETYFPAIEEVRVRCGTNEVQTSLKMRGRCPEAWMNLQRLLDYSQNTTIDPDWLGTNGKPCKFCIGINLALTPGSDDDNFLTGNATKGTVIVEIRCNSPPPEPIEYTCFLLADKWLYCGQTIGTVARGS